jgi:hypothetical protein
MGNHVCLSYCSAPVSFASAVGVARSRSVSALSAPFVASFSALAAAVFASADPTKRLNESLYPVRKTLVSEVIYNREELRGEVEGMLDFRQTRVEYGCFLVGFFGGAIKSRVRVTVLALRFHAFFVVVVVVVR